PTTKFENRDPRYVYCRGSPSLPLRQQVASSVDIKGIAFVLAIERWYGKKTSVGGCDGVGATWDLHHPTCSDVNRLVALEIDLFAIASRKTDQPRQILIDNRPCVPRDIAEVSVVRCGCHHGNVSRV